ALGGTGLEGLFLEAVELLLLADVGAVGDDFGLVGVFQPGQEDGGVEAAGVGDENFFDVFAHGDFRKKAGGTLRPAPLLATGFGGRASLPVPHGGLFSSGNPGLGELASSPWQRRSSR